MKRSGSISLLFLCILGLSLGTGLVLADDDIIRPEGWDEYSHGKSADPDYAVVFPQDDVNTLTITIDPENWQAALDDMTGLYGEFGTRSHGGGMGDRPEGMGQAPEGGGERPEGMGQPPEDGGAPPEGMGQLPEDVGERPEGMGQPPEGGGERPEGMGQAPGGGGDRPGGMGGGGAMGLDENPMWIPVDIAFEDQIWTNVGFRFKGNSSLMSTWGGGIYKLPFKLDFDEFEDDYPEIDNQRFYGFKQLSFSSNWNDDSLLREKVTADIFREAGVPSAQTAFYTVYVDYGEGPLYFGLYTAVEVVDNTVIKTQFDDDNGNVYKPEGTGATFAAGTFDEESFDKETNEDDADYSDILALFDALHAETRTTDPATWRSDLETVFDVDGFMHWLAVNTVIQNWDTYGRMAHNYYLYNDPTTGQLTWIPWDNNMALSDSFGGGGGRDNNGGPGGRNGQMADNADETADNSDETADNNGGRMGPGGGNGQMADNADETAGNNGGRMAPGGGGPGGGNGGPGGGSNSVTLDLEGVSSDWPLIRYLMDDSVYHDLYVQYVDQTINGAFEPAKMEATYQVFHDLIAPYVVGENGEKSEYTNLSSAEAFDTALTELIDHVNQRYADAQTYLSSQTATQ